MKKLIGVFCAVMMVMLVACASTEDVKTEETTFDTTAYAGVYCYTYEEEFDGEDTVFMNYLVLNTDMTGYWIVQDTIPMVWNENTITAADITYEYTMKDSVISVDVDGNVEQYYKTGSPLPKELQDTIDALK